MIEEEHIRHFLECCNEGDLDADDAAWVLEDYLEISKRAALAEKLAEVLHLTSHGFPGQPTYHCWCDEAFAFCGTQECVVAREALAEYKVINGE